MRNLILAAVLAVTGAGAAAAGEPAKAAKPHVVLCDRDGMAERAIKREHGSAEWTTSAEVLSAIKNGQGWAAPRCMSSLEYWRMTDGLRRMQRAEAARARAERLLASR